MSHTFSIEDIKQKIHQFRCAETPDNKAMAEYEFFVMGQGFIDFGTLRIEGCFMLHRLDFVNVYEVDIRPYYHDFLVVEIWPEFKAACEEYKRPSDVISREESNDDYDQALGFDSDELEIDFEDYRGECGFLMSEFRLRQAL